MTSVGIFAGRGDVLLGYLVTLVLGIIVGWYIRRLYSGLVARFAKKDKSQ